MTSPAEREQIGISRVWITHENRAKLLDIAPPGVDENSRYRITVIHRDGEFTEVRRFLDQVATSALDGRLADSESRALSHVVPPLALHAQSILHQLKTLTAVEPLIDQTESTLNGNPEVTRAQRLGMLCACVALPLLVTLAWLVMYARFPESDSVPEDRRLIECLYFVDRLAGDKEPDSSLKRDLKIYVASQFGEIISDPLSWDLLVDRNGLPNRIRFNARRIAATYPNPTREQIRQANVMYALNRENMSTPALFQFPLPVFLALWGSSLWIGMVVIPASIAAVLFREGLVMRMFGVVAVMENGLRASRMRLLWRSLIFATPGVLLLFVTGVTRPLTWIPCVGFAVVLAMALVSTGLPHRGLADRVAGTFLVPR